MITNVNTFLGPEYRFFLHRWILDHILFQETGRYFSAALTFPSAGLIAGKHDSRHYGKTLGPHYLPAGRMHPEIRVIFACAFGVGPHQFDLLLLAPEASKEGGI